MVRFSIHGINLLFEFRKKKKIINTCNNVNNILIKNFIIITICHDVMTEKFACYRKKNNDKKKMGNISGLTPDQSEKFIN